MKKEKRKKQHSDGDGVSKILEFLGWGFLKILLFALFFVGLYMGFAKGDWWLTILASVLLFITLIGLCVWGYKLIRLIRW